VRNWFGQPPGLTILFLTEMWEKFSFFGMRALLVYYMTKRLGIETARASMIYGIYAAFVYFTPILGTFWGRIDHAVFSAAMAGLAALSSVLLFWLKGSLE